MKKTRRTFFCFFPYDRSRIEKYLEKMAKKGWILENFDGLIFRFCKQEPRTVRYTVIYSQGFDPDYVGVTRSQLLYREMCQQAGWIFCGDCCDMEIYRSMEENPLPIETEPQTEFEEIVNSVKERTKYFWIQLIVICWYLLKYHSLIRSQPVEALSDVSTLVSMSCWILLLLFCLAMMLGFTIWRRNGRRIVQQGRFVREYKLYGICWSALLVGGVILLIAYMRLTKCSRESVMSAINFACFLVGLFLLKVFERMLSHEKLSAKERRGISALLACVMFLVLSGIVRENMERFIPEEPIRYEFLDREPLDIEENKTGTVKIYDDDIPLKIEDFMDVTGLKFNRSFDARQTAKSPLMEVLSADQWLYQGESELDWLAIDYSIITFHVPFVYDRILWTITDGQLYTGEKYVPLNPEEWNAEAVYQYGVRYLICWNDRIVILDLYGAAELSADQMAIIGQKLRDAAWPG